ncbi:MAG: hypothetical protein FWC01_01260 [Treponema sp.]|nr:hypothetical protein [Treponema sp.]MCL2236760.1 hypothetical protein [Treponema sp.]
MVEKFGDYRYTTDFTKVDKKILSQTKDYASGAIKKEDFVSALWVENAKAKTVNFVLITKETIFDNSNAQFEHMSTQTILKIEDVLQFKVLTKSGKDFIFFKSGTIPKDIKPRFIEDIKKVQGKLR